ncbi:hypothetical protein [Clostridium sp.]|uniref:hypothetical protein n=1 Tax=Clostridium sp. TaxID=1506 RepID=UPI003D6D01D6
MSELIETPVTLNVSNESLDLIVKMAIEEGGSSYWICDVKSKYKNNKSIASGAVLLIYGTENNVYELNKNKLLNGLHLVLPYLKNAIIGDTLDANFIDADTADFIVQMGIFNELRYD